MDNNIKSIIDSANNLEEAPSMVIVEPKSSSNAGANNSSSYKAYDDTSSVYNFDVLEERYLKLPDTGISWRQSDVINQEEFRYSRIKAIKNPNKDGTYSKQPLDKWGNSSTCKGWNDLKNGDDYAVVVSHPYLCIDIDDDLEARIIFKYIVDKGVKCMVMRTSRGAHFWFRLPRDIDYESTGIKNESMVPIIGALTFVDYRVNGKGLATLRFLGKDRPIIYGADIPSESWEEPPLILRKLCKANVKEYDFIGLVEGNRDNLLNRYKAALYGREHLEISEVFEVLSFVNGYLFSQPLDDCQMAKFNNPQNYEGIGREVDSSEFFSKSKFLHEKFAKYIAGKYCFIPTDNKHWPYIYKDGYYQQDDDGVEMLVRDLVPELTTNNIAQIQSALHIEAVRRLRRMDGVLDENGIIKENPFYCNLNNGRLNLLTGELSEHSPNFIDTQRVPTTFNPEAKCEAIDTVLNNVFQGNQELIDFFFEICGSCLIRDNHLFIRSFFFVGEGSNGKSTVLRMIKAMVGAKNICCVKPSEMISGAFSLASIKDKLANIVEELSATDVDETDIYKQVVAGDVVSANVKFKDFVTFSPYATCVFAMNAVPNFKDKSMGMKRRFECVPFNANFEKLKREHPENFDPSISDKITSEEAKSYLLNMAIAGFRRAYERKDYDVPECCKVLKSRILEENNPVVQWIIEKGYTPEDFTVLPFSYLYPDFRKFQIEELGKEKPWSRAKWKQEVLRHFGEFLESETKRVRLDKNDRNNIDTVFVLKNKN